MRKSIIRHALKRILMQMITIKFFILMICISLTISLFWMQVTNDDDLINEALENGARDYRFAEVYRKTEKLSNNMKYMLLWTNYDVAPFYYFGIGQRKFIEKNCSIINCYVTTDRYFFRGNLTKFDAVAFNGRSLNDIESDIPRERSSSQKYIYFNLESADNYPICTNRFDNFFNWTATYNLKSDIPFPYIQIKNKYGEIIGPKQKMIWPRVTDTDIEEYDYRQNKSKAVAWFVSHCRSRNGRGLYASLLKKALKLYGWTVDIYGACGPFKCPRELKNSCELILERDYFFYLSFENSLSEDYVTEKLLTALQHNVVPIVLGGADYSRFLPPGSYLDATKTEPKQLAAAINNAIKSPVIYNSFFEWKTLYTYNDPSVGDCLCDLCAALNNKSFFDVHSSYSDLRSWWHPNYKQRCKMSHGVI